MRNNIQNILSKNLAELIKYSTNVDRIALAVSGGVDSVAMLVLMSDWARAKNIELVVITVDHNVRLESKAECLYVKELSNRLGYVCHILEWNPNWLKNFQDQARNARYKLMTDLCTDLKIETLISAHHFDDAIEHFSHKQYILSTLLVLRTNNVRYINSIRIVKPLFNIKKEKLIKYLKSEGVLWFEDSSNKSEKYTRNRIRKYISEQGKDFKNNIILQMNAKNVEAKKLQLELIRAIGECISINNYGVAKINLIIFRNFTDQTKINLINYILTIIGGHTRMPRTESTKLILDLLSQDRNFTKTLHNCALIRYENVLTIHYELGKINHNSIISPLTSHWSNRFRYHKAASTMNFPEINITYLSTNDYIDIKSKINLQNLYHSVGNIHYKKILFTLPVIKVLEKLVAIPHISYYDDRLFEKDYFTFSPKFISRFTHFC